MFIWCDWSLEGEFLALFWLHAAYLSRPHTDAARLWPWLHGSGSQVIICISTTVLPYAKACQGMRPVLDEEIDLERHMKDVTKKEKSRGSPHVWCCSLWIVNTDLIDFYHTNWCQVIRCQMVQLFNYCTLRLLMMNTHFFIIQLVTACFVPTLSHNFANNAYALPATGLSSKRVLLLLLPYYVKCTSDCTSIIEHLCIRHQTGCI